MGSYVPATSSEQQEMLEAIGLRDFRELYGDVPEEMYLRAPLDIPEGLSELEVSRKLRAMAAKNHVFSTVLRGAGAYDHYIPSVVSYSRQGGVPHSVYPLPGGNEPRPSAVYL